MKRILLRPTVIICSLALLLTLVTRSYGKKQTLQGRYKQSNAGNTCFPFTDLPGDCTSTVTGVFCETPFGSLTRKWYADACVTPFYKIP